jgi:hypothetical protein
MYRTNYSFYEENINGEFNNVEPYEYSILTEKHPTSQNDLDVLFECMEIERIGATKLLVEKEIVKTDKGETEYVDSDTAIVDIQCIAYTRELSPYINWEVSNKVPPIYKVDREKTKFTINNQ